MGMTDLVADFNRRSQEARERLRQEEDRRKAEAAKRLGDVMQNVLPASKCAAYEPPPWPHVDVEAGTRALLLEWGFPADLVNKPFKLPMVTALGQAPGTWPKHRDWSIDEWTESPPATWTLVGCKGAGKTMLAIEVARRAWMRERVKSYFITGPNLVAASKAPLYGEHAVPLPNQPMERAKTAKLLVFDELVFRVQGAEQARTHTVLRELIHHRTAHGLRSIYTAHCGFAKSLPGDSSGVMITTWNTVISERLREGAVAMLTENKRPELPDF